MGCKGLITGTCGIEAEMGLYRAIPAVSLGLGFYGLIWRTIQLSRIIEMKLELILSRRETENKYKDLV